MTETAECIKKLTNDIKWCSDYRGKSYLFDQCIELTSHFYGFVAPGLIIGTRMVDLAMKNLSKQTMFEAICEISFCLPDAIQLLTLCTTGNGRLRVIHLGRFAVVFYNKYNGEGIRVFLDPEKIEDLAEIKNWFYKLLPKKEQNYDLLVKQIRDSEDKIYSVQRLYVNPDFIKKRFLGKTVNYPVCGEAYPEKYGKICKGCNGDIPYKLIQVSEDVEQNTNIPVPLSFAVGSKLLHDMTMIIPGEKKEACFKKGYIIKPGDICRLQLMGKENIIY